MPALRGRSGDRPSPHHASLPVSAGRLPKSDGRHCRRIGAQDARAKAQRRGPLHASQPLGLGFSKATFRPDQNCSGARRRLYLDGLSRCSLVTPVKPPIPGPLRQHAIKRLKIRHLRHECGTALLGRLNRMRLQTILPDPFGIGVPRLHRQYAPHAKLDRLFHDEIRARLLDRREDQPKIGRKGQGPLLRLANDNAAALASLRNPGKPFPVLPVKHKNRRASTKPHDPHKVMRLIRRQRHCLPLTQRLIYKKPYLGIRHERDPMSQPPRTPEAAPLEDLQSMQAGHVADAPAGNFVDRFAPVSTRPYLRLSRADRPIGTWLLLIPCLWAITMAASNGGFRGWDLWLALSCAAGAFLMRGAGCTWNDITDRDIDAKVARTRSRPIPSGQISVRQALIWMAVQALLAAAILLTYNSLAILLGIASLALVAIYPFAKRFTWWPQVFLGLAFNWGALLAWAAHSGTVPSAALCLYAAGIAWTLYYDTIYAHQDREDDALIGVKSTARLFGANSRLWLFFFFALTISLFALSVIVALAPTGRPIPLLVALAGIWAMGWHMAWQMRGLDLDDPASCLAAFRANRDTGLIPVPFLAAAALL
jgi:4-hydroxybenzoate polyprenyltransferase